MHYAEQDRFALYCACVFPTLIYKPAVRGARQIETLLCDAVMGRASVFLVLLVAILQLQSANGSPMTRADRAVQDRAIPSAKDLMDKAKAFVQVRWVCSIRALHLLCMYRAWASDTIIPQT